jgi:hypothetical protein
VTGREGPGPERPGPDYPPEWDAEPAEEEYEPEWCELLVGPFTLCGEPLAPGEDRCPEHLARLLASLPAPVPDPWASQGPVPPPPF